MRHFAVQVFARMALCATVAQCALACGADSDHGPPIGSPTGPVGPVVNEGGGNNGTGGAANATGGRPAIDGTTGGALNGPSSGGDNSFGFAGANSPAGGAFGSGGFTTGSDPFARAGGPSAVAGSFF